MRDLEAMMKKNWRWPAAGVVGLLAAISVFVVPAIGEDTVFADVGTLRLHMDGDGDRLVYDPVAADEPNLTQTLTQTNCKLASSGDSLMNIVGTSSVPIKRPAAGLRDHRIGVVQLLEHHELCARIDGIIGQKLTLGLTGAVAESDVGYAEIDLGFKHNGSAILELRDGGPSGAVVDTVTVLCTSKANCGPDSKGDNNRRVILWINPEDNPGSGLWHSEQVPAVFDTIVIKPGSSSIKSSISLEAGFHGSPRGPLGTALNTNDTLFTVVEPFEGELDCEATVNLDEGGDATQQVTRGQDTNGECGKGVLGFNFESGVEADELFVDFITQTVESGETAQFLEVITWNFDGPPASGQNRTLFYDDHVGAGRREMPWCLTDPRDGEGNLPVGTTENPVDTTLYLPEGHTSCLIESDSTVTMGGDFVVVDVVYNVADGRRWKG
jgi:hypothetical protein